MNPSKPINILVTNDDGIHADGLLALKSALATIGNIWVVAPDRPRSACGHSITLHKPLRLNKVRLADGTFGFACSGTPSDCVSLGVLGVVAGTVDLVVSGINRGPNLGWDLTYSGTVSAAMEGVIAGIPSIAVSITSYEEDLSFDYAANFAAFLGKKVLDHGLPPDTLLNVNIPPVPALDIAGIRITRQGRRRYHGTVEERVDPTGKTYYWLGGDVSTDELEEATDVKAIAENKVSVTPVHLDLTSYNALEQLESWEIGGFEMKG
jgi:5'-nucleotidase